MTLIYELTERGQALMPALDLIAAWARDIFRPAIADSNAQPPLVFDTARTHWHHQLAVALCRLAASFLPW